MPQIGSKKGLGSVLGNKVLDVDRRKEPLWKGPQVDGVTFSMLSRFLQCRERFRIHTIEGLRPVDQFNHRIEYGNMWHVCEEAFASEVRYFGEFVGTTVIEDSLKEYVRQLCAKYPMQQDQVDHWYNVCKVQFPYYVKYWKQHPDVIDRTPICQERVFDIQYKLPSGREVRLRGKYDAVDMIGRSNKCVIKLQENKSKGTIDPGQIQRQLSFDLQTMLYLTTLTQDTGIEEIENAKLLAPVTGVRYNVVRRPLSGGVGTIRRHKGTANKPEETLESFYSRVAQYIKDDPASYFMRWSVDISKSDIDTFRKTCLDPLLENLVTWYDRISRHPSNPWEDYTSQYSGRSNEYHWRHPFGIRNMLDEGGTSDLDEYLQTGSRVGLKQIDNLFPEL